ncbi:OB-fold domain-containing protein [Streptomyces sp. LX-29]|uniref:Zn-ribbon domain-containing OB-fold protein n=1 Tax=Streptomyces sp. LX-29 TaxID=2900152 RepID=UPI00240E4C8D|nr:OB-fold nucleic acid binding domain-containing protein [Streptomyces sp. LX-29]WFB06346.1 OB-fold domain-containing protein [Streptomyces sp. LX-29]
MSELLSAPLTVEFPFTRSLGPVQGAFLTGLRERVVLGVRRPDGRVLVPPLEYDPDTAADLHELVEVGTTGTVTCWAWNPTPRRGQPLGTPFAWVLVRLDGADSALLHALDAPDPGAVRTGLRVRVRWAAERTGAITDIACFEAYEGEGEEGGAHAADVAEPADRADGAEVADRTDVAEPADRADGAEAADRTDVAEPVDRADGAEVADRTDVAEPADRADGADAAGRTDVEEPADAADPTGAVPRARPHDGVFADPVTSLAAPARLDYTYTPGRAHGRHLAALADRRTVGERCPACRKVYVPPRGACPTCGVATDEPVEVGPRGTVTTFCVVNIKARGLAIEVPYVYAHIALDGADLALHGRVAGLPYDRVRMGLRVEPVWVGDGRHPDHYRPTGEPDAPYDTYRELL